MRAVRRTLGWAVALAVIAGLGLILWSTLRGRPQDLPWTPLDLGQPIGLMTGRKLNALTQSYPACQAALERAGVRYTALPPRSGEGQCGYSDGVRFTSGGARRIDFAPAGLGVACPVAAALAIWEWNVVQPAAERHFGTKVTSIDHFGSYSCRRIYGRDAGTWSEHSTADAVDIAGFRLGNGTRITVARDWRGDNEKAAFLREVRDGACQLFATTLSPDYNAAHADHFHLDQADRGAMGWRACR
ncbi:MULTISPECIES: extensin-like domain-containing protein [unclassified Sphingomonas]|uniref:extensin-like domain-containing protein n=1 Tax=unclassified Sphingomonas TaxID=196159 RepID=UPI0006F76FAF|nr:MULTISPECIES: extensin family protein [unclassified Sphingomonas]KQN20915.1 extensin [Sphingomonas sp. Leaf30]MBD8550423.1 extensin family protein [Sphingomonas sp. CFBP 8764]